ALALARSAGAVVGDVEPNDSFAQRSLQNPGILAVNGSIRGELAGPAAPDTILGRFDGAGHLLDLNDDAPDDPRVTVGDGNNSALLALAVTPGPLLFRVTGYDDYDFDGLSGSDNAGENPLPHAQHGPFTLQVDYLNGSGALLSSQTANGTLSAGAVLPFS